MRAFARARGPDIGDKEAVGLEMLRAALEADGLPESGWLRHPLPTLQEPNKDVRWITPTPNMEPGDTARLYVGASLGRVDNVFELTRRSMSALERPFYTPSGGCNQVWYGHAPYNPDMVRKYLDIFQAVNNFIHTGADGVTPAMRLGFADRPLAYADVLWPGEKIPVPKQPCRNLARRVIRGRAVQRRAAARLAGVGVRAARDEFIDFGAVPGQGGGDLARAEILALWREGDLLLFPRVPDLDAERGPHGVRRRRRSTALLSAGRRHCSVPGKPSKSRTPASHSISAVDLTAAILSAALSPYCASRRRPAPAAMQ